ncbi:DUF2785 domain-containing protein [Paenibacillus donghaensis]|uniref:DUF2785 domain-containing protein n=1 Tax=Paenibacillus donghaensis TaxID=414771 RepID=A0A2Z2KJP7_9BACL|nr:DUF2785 domain-containing protein [Paenibacillus donghaensis]ASA26494.1 hypothetical protein B9T62_26680 [Paenibacillus donghaensis]
MQDLQRIEDEHYHLREGEREQDFLTLMLQYIGDPEPELRDNLIYPTFYEWIMEQQKFTDDELRILLRTLTDEQHLFYQIGSEGSPSVFTRTFAVLPVALILMRHRKQPILKPAEFLAVKGALLRYYREEKDLRGYVAEGGWAHSAAHAADALDELVQCPESDTSVQLEILAAIQGMLHNGLSTFAEEEEERIATIVDTMLEQELLPEQQVVEWIGGLSACASQPKCREQVIARVNSKNLVRCLYFRRVQGTRSPVLEAALLAAEAALNKFAVQNTK